MSKNILLISGEVLKKRTSVHSNLDPKLLTPEIKVVQDMYIQPILGSGLFNKLLSDINADALVGEYRTLVDDYLTDTVMWYTLWKLPLTLSYQFWNKGVVRKQGEDTELPSMSELVDISNEFKNRAEFYANRMKKYLQQNAPTKFFEYLNPGTGIDTIIPDMKSFSNPVYLGEDDCPCSDDPHKFEKQYQGNRPNCCGE